MKKLKIILNIFFLIILIFDILLGLYGIFNISFGKRTTVINDCYDKFDNKMIDIKCLSTELVDGRTYNKCIILSMAIFPFLIFFYNQYDLDIFG